MLKLNNIQVTVGKGTRLETKVLHNLSLNVDAGEFVILIGNNGCGKSTLFNTIAANVMPDSGNILIDDTDITDQPQNKRSTLVSLVMQEPRIGTMDNMTLEENLSFAYMRGRTRKLNLYGATKRRELFKEKLSILNMNLENRLDELVGNLSGGQRQVLSLIMAIIADYKVLLMDEITAALDPKTADNVMEIAAKLVQEEQRTALMITHNMQYALDYGHRTLLMTRGHIFCEYDMNAKRTMTPATLATEIANLQY